MLILYNSHWKNSPNKNLQTLSSINARIAAFFTRSHLLYFGLSNNILWKLVKIIGLFCTPNTQPLIISVGKCKATVKPWKHCIGLISNLNFYSDMYVHFVLYLVKSSSYVKFSLNNRFYNLLIRITRSFYEAKYFYILH